jgi:transcriptional regulator NrdR family protein
MICPYCGKGRALVYDSRPGIALRGAVWRRRKCEKCRKKFQTLEQVVEKKDKDK